MFENFKERLLSAQQDLSSGLKTLGDKSKEVKIKKSSTADGLPKFAAGAELLSRYETTWAALHKRTEECAKVGEVVDGKVVVLSAYWEKRRNQLFELQEQLEEIPALLVGLDALTSKLAQLETEFQELEGHLLHLEDIYEQCELERYKQFQILKLENYKKQKRKRIEALKAELDSEHAQKVRDMENTQQLKLKERQKFFEEAFQQDLEQYLSTGHLQIAQRREPIGSMSSMEVNVDMLEQMDLMDMSDQEALDVFLNSGGEDSSEISPVLGSKSEPQQGEITLQVPNQDELRLKLSSFSSTSADNASHSVSEDDTPLVQSDEEEVQIDTSLVTMNSDLKENADSDSQ
ncbi:dysbindin-A isoform X1 [Hemiscyllium ocellatum]|uniref:dysbindin-A isoform X1 n=1 Tax=Hemiscyllium ocellatum TaxID=170820 RepID=UPI002965FCE5|nr:dysbindin-A isoform X1 [Hemiscyllium ocellatum]